jgi:hypothetical protein
MTNLKTYMSMLYFLKLTVIQVSKSEILGETRVGVSRPESAVSQHVGSNEFANVVTRMVLGAAV